MFEDILTLTKASVASADTTAASLSKSATLSRGRFEDDENWSIKPAICVPRCSIVALEIVSCKVGIIRS